MTTPSLPRRPGEITLRAGFMPLTDAASLIAAARLGFAREEGLSIELERETSWATLRDRMAVRHLDVAHMLAPMPIADALGLTPLPIDLVVPMALGFGGNTITVSTSLARELAEAGAPAAGDAAGTAAAFSRVVAARRWAGRPRLTLAIVHSFSAHHYQLAYWLGWAGIAPQSDVDLVVLPPPLMTAALASGQIDGFCAGEPWGSAAAAGGAGRVLTTSAHIWQRAPEKVLGVSRVLAEDAPDAVARLVRAVYRAAAWCDDPDHHGDLARLLAEPAHIGQSTEVILAGLSRRPGSPGHELAPGSGFLAFASDGAMFPWISHAAWFHAQMARWRQAPWDGARAATAMAVYRPDLYRAALAPLGLAVPTANRKIEGGGSDGGADAFFDGRTFDSDQVEAYLASFAAR